MAPGPIGRPDRDAAAANALSPPGRGNSLATMPDSILITGASSGIGAALALAYARAGTRLVLTGRDAVRLGEIEAACRQRGATVTAALLDVVDRAAMAAF
ncbi:MAG: SDR family NAD(P)-dependent oxidoreductase [Pseudomonadota bacterium]